MTLRIPDEVPADFLQSSSKKSVRTQSRPADHGMPHKPGYYELILSGQRSEHEQMGSHSAMNLRAAMITHPYS